MNALTNHIATVTNRYLFLTAKIKSKINVVPIYPNQNAPAWVIAAFAMGAVIYLKLPLEATFPMVLSAAVAVAVVALTGKGNIRSLMLIAAMPLLAGFAYMQMTTHTIAQNKPPAHLTGTHEITATIETWQDRGNKHYLTLGIDRLNNDRHDFKARIRVYDSQMPAAGVNLGDRVSVLARIAPPKPAQLEGGFDSRKFFFLQNIHYSGFAVGDMHIIANYDGNIASLKDVGHYIHHKSFTMRLAVADRIRSAITGDEGEVAAALLTGLRGRIDQDIVDNMRYSGLAHLLAISGLHMGCAALSVFFLVRLCLSLRSRWALCYPIKKIAAMAAIGTAFIYLLLSGDSISATRAWMMVTLALVAVLLDRRVFNMRSVAISAFLILLFDPRQVTGVGFQLSYLAVIGLIAFYEWRSKAFSYQPTYGNHRNPLAAVFLSVSKPLRVAAMTTLIAGFATIPAISHYFGYVAPYSLVANLLAVPLTGLVIIPSGFIGLALMPFGLEGLPLAVMGFALSQLLFIAEFTRHLPAGEWHPQHFSGLAYGIFVIGFLWVCLCRTKVRLYGFALVALSFAMWGNADKPTAIIQGGKAVVAVALEDGRYILHGGRVGDYRTRRWQQRYGLGEFIKYDDIAGSGVACDAGGCRFGEDLKVIVSFDRNLSGEHCSQADMVVAYYNRADFATCLQRGITFIRYDELRDLGAMMIYGDRIRFAVSQKNRLWQYKR